MKLSVYFVTPDGASDDLIFAAIKGGAHAIQLRDKCASDAQMIEQARRLLPITAAAGVPLIINDRLDVALACGADGLHIGQSDGSPAEFRAALGAKKILGLSIEAYDQIAQIPKNCVDYIGVGPVFATVTKPDHAKPLSLTGLEQIARAAGLPVVAIGGLGAGDIPVLKAAGCAGMAVVSAISSGHDPEAATRKLVKLWGV